VKQLDDSIAHLVIVEQDIGQMGGQQSVDSSTGAHKEHIRVEDASAQAARQHSGKVDAGDPCGTMDHLQRQAENQLHCHIKSEMEPSGMEHHVEEEAPDLVPFIRAVDEHRVRRYGSPWSSLTRDH